MSQSSSLPQNPSPIPLPPISRRLPSFVGGGLDAAERLAALRVGIFTAGSVASRIAQHLARLQPAEIVIADPGVLKAESVLTYDILPADIGRSKAEWTAERCRAISPRTKIRSYVEWVQDLPRHVWADCHVLIGAPDNLACEAFAGEVAMSLRKPLFLAAVHGETLTAQIRGFANSSVDSPCAVCNFNPDEWRAHDESIRFSCQGNRDAARARPTMSTSFLCSQAADLAAMQVIRYVLGLGTSVLDTLVSTCGFTHRTIVAPLRRNSQCRRDHRQWQIIRVTSPLEDFCVDDLVRLAQGFLPPAASPVLQVDGFVFAESAYCCGQELPIGRFTAAATSVLCPKCGLMAPVPEYFQRKAVPCGQLPSGVPLRAIGATAIAELRISSEASVAWFLPSQISAGVAT